MALRIWVGGSDSASTPAHRVVCGLPVDVCGGVLSAATRLPEPNPHVLIAVLPGDHPDKGIDACAGLARAYRDVPIIAVATEVTPELAVAAMRAGCIDLLQWPYSTEALGDAIQRALARRCWPEETEQEAPEPPDAASAVEGTSPHMAGVRAAIRRIAPSRSTVLITGETGTGKELVSELIHGLSPQAAQPFVRLNCAAIPETLLESELFGHERGAFTGASHPSPGKLQLAGHGTLLLDEIGDMSPFAQAKLLRAIESRQAYRLGGRTAFAVNCRFIAATNSNLERDVSEGRFRKDLYYRLNVARIRLAPLRERPEDIEPLCRRFMREFDQDNGIRVESMEPRVAMALLRHEWPGNVRELRNVIEASYLHRPAGRLEWRHLPDWFVELAGPKQVPEGERAQIEEALQTSGGNKSVAAAKLGVSRTTLYRRMERLQLPLDKGVAS